LAYKEALDFYRRAKDLDPNYATGRFNMAAALVELSIPTSPSTVTAPARKATIQIS
jgi:hypothetical protein